MSVIAALEAPGSRLRSLAFPASLRGKLVLAAVLVSVVTAFVVGAVNYGRIVTLTRNNALERIDSQVAILLPQIVLHYRAMKVDAETVSRTPPFQGLRRAIENGGVDPKDGSTVQVWRERLETIFKSVMVQHSAYLQMRFIGLADNGREIVRVNRSAGKLVSVAPENLQQKGDEFYFRQARTLKPEQYYLSPITSNREWGKVQADAAPMLRVVVPVNAPDRGPMYGMLVINVDALMFFDEALSQVRTPGELTIVTELMDYVQRAADGTFGDFRYRSATQPDAPFAAQLLSGPKPIGRTHFHGEGEAETAIRTAEFSPAGARGNHRLRLALALPLGSFLAEALAVRDQTLATVLILILGLSVVAFVLAQGFTAPLGKMVDQIVAFSGDRQALNLPVSREDEIGELSRAFTGLVEDLNRLTHEAEVRLERLNSLRENAADALITTDQRGRITDFNRAAEDLLGYSAQEVQGLNIRLFMPEPVKAAHDGYMQRYLETGEGNTVGKIRTVEARRKDGTLFPAELRVNEVWVEGRRVYDGILRDITGRVAMERRIADHMDELQRSNRELDDFAYIASHDLKEPLRAIANHVRFLEEDEGARISNGGRRRIARIEQLTQRLDRLTSDLFEWSRLNRTAANDSDIDLNAMIDDICESLAEMTTEKGALVTVEGSLPTVRGDPVRVESVFRNLIVNGIKYNESPEKRIEIGVEGRKRYKNGVSADVFYVRDNGIGIAPDYQQDVFAIFKRLNSEKAYGPGTGAGLSFVKKIIESRNGTIWLESAVGSGSTFFFTLWGNHEAA